MRSLLVQCLTRHHLANNVTETLPQAFGRFSLVQNHFKHRPFSLLPSSVFFSTQIRSFSTRNFIKVALLGPPNSGKSTLFNRLIDKKANKTYKLSSEKKKNALSSSSNRRISGRLKSAQKASGTAIVSAEPGTTRDRRECIGRIGATYFTLIDTAGVDGDRIDQSRRRGASLVQAMMQQTLEAARQADLVFLMLDARVGVTTDFDETVRWLRKVSLATRIVVLANKLEGDAWDYDGSPILEHLAEVIRVGFGEAIPISAQHGEGMADLAVIIEDVAREKGASVELEDDESEESTREKPLQLAILGRQNVGKSTLVNALLKQDRVITGSTPGLTRDAIAIEWSWNGRPVQLVDTAGIRKQSQREDEIEDMAVQDAMRAMKLADVAVLVLDADARMLQRQELAIMDAILKEGRALVVAANKMDLILDADYSKQEFAEQVREQLEGRFPMLRKTPIVPMSSLSGDSVQELMPVVFKARDRWERVISTSQLNRWIQQVSQDRPWTISGKPVRIKYMMQTKGRPPTFLLFCNVDQLPDSYIRYLTRHFQDTFEMFGMEVRLAVKKGSNPYEPENKRSGSGLGGHRARKERLIQQLKTTGAPTNRRRKRSRRS